MRDTKADLETLLSSIQEGLKQFTIAELNDAIIAFLNKKNDKSLEINYVLQIVGNEFKLSRTALLSKRARGMHQEAKQIAYCLLHFNLGLSLRYIANRVFFNNHNSVAIGIKRLKNADPKIKIDKAFLEKYNSLQCQLIAKYATPLKQNGI
jgi:chromosomal replication initiation ATPase DnaA